MFPVKSKIAWAKAAQIRNEISISNFSGHAKKTFLHLWASVTISSKYTATKELDHNYYYIYHPVMRATAITISSTYSSIVVNEVAI